MINFDTFVPIILCEYFPKKAGTQFPGISERTRNFSHWNWNLNFISFIENEEFIVEIWNKWFENKALPSGPMAVYSIVCVNCVNLWKHINYSACARCLICSFSQISQFLDLVSSGCLSQSHLSLIKIQRFEFGREREWWNTIKGWREKAEKINHFVFIQKRMCRARTQRQRQWQRIQKGKKWNEMVVMV